MLRRVMCLRFKYLIASLVICWFASLASNADADIRINSKSNLVLLSGYSIDLAARQELTPVSASLNELFNALQGDLHNMFNANVVHLSELSLAQFLDLQRLPKGTPETAIPKLFESQKYTHLIVADVSMTGRESGLVDLQVAKLSQDGSIVAGETQVMQRIELTTRPGQVDVARHQILRDFLKLRDVDAPKTVFISCILPSSLSVSSDPLAILERLLGRSATSSLINFYHSAKMQERYRPLVDRHTYNWDKDLSCNSTTTSTVTIVTAHEYDYLLDGVVAISHSAPNNFGYDEIDLEIEVSRTHPDCVLPLQISEKLSPKQYFDKETFATSFSARLPEKFGPKWTDDVENKSCN